MSFRVEISALGSRVREYEVDMQFDFDAVAAGIQRSFQENESLKSFQSLIADTIKDPQKYCRNSAEYLLNVFEYYGHYEVADITGDPIRRWRIFDLFFPVNGHEAAQNQIYNYIKSFSENRNNKIILLHGPNGSAKTSLVSSIMGAAEDYAQKPEGAVFSFNWIFSDGAEHEVGLGFGATGNEKKVTYDSETLAFVEPEDITFKLPCPMKDNPLLLIPAKERREFLSSLGLKRPPQHLLKGSLCQKCNEIYSQLLITYNGDWKRIIRHIQVERFAFSKRFRKGLISIDPQETPDASSRPLNLEQSYRIPRALAMTSIFEPYGDLIDANRGVVEFSEFFKRHKENNKYLLTTAEWGTINLKSFTGYLDCVIFATCNEKNLSTFKIDLDWPSFNGRFAYVRVPYLLRPSHELLSCQKIITEHAHSIHVAPHTDEVFSLWSVGTRLRKSEHPLASKLSHTQKAQFYDKQTAPPSWPMKDQQNLLKDLQKIVTEYEDSRARVIAKQVDDASYEGRSGASFRDMENIVINAVYKKHYLSPLSLFNAIEDVIKHDSVYEFLRIHRGNDGDTNYEKGHIEPKVLLREVKLFYYDLVKKDIRKAAGLVSDAEYTNLFERYIQHVKSWTREEKIQNRETGVWEAADERLMSRLETKLGIKADNAKDHRKEMFNKIASWAIKNDISKGIPYDKLFADFLDALRKNSDNEQKSQIQDMEKYMLMHNTDDWKMIPEEKQKEVTTAVQNMLALGYTEESLKEAVGWTFGIKEGA